MSAVIWSAAAIADLDAVGDYWRDRNPAGLPGLARKIDAAAAFLSTAPLAGPASDGRSVRKWRICGTNYILLYRRMADGIEILRLHHVRQNWRDPA